MYMFPFCHELSRQSCYFSASWAWSEAISPSYAFFYQRSSSMVVLRRLFPFIQKYRGVQQNWHQVDSIITYNHSQKYSQQFGQKHRQKRVYNFMRFITTTQPSIRILILIQQKMGQDHGEITTKQGWHQKFGKVQLVLDSSTSTLVYICATITLEDGGKAWKQFQLNTKKLRLYLQIANWLILPIRSEQSNCLACTIAAQKSSVKLFYNPFKTSLQHDIRTRKESLSFYDPNRMWYFLFVLLRVANAFEKCGFYLGNLHPSNLFLSTFQELSVYSLLSAPNELSNLDKIRSSKYEDAFLAPQEIQIIEQEQETIEKGSRVDSFCIGLVLLSALLLKDCYYLYNRTIFSLNRDKFSVYQQELKALPVQQCPNALKQIVLSLLELSPARNPPSVFLQPLLAQQAHILRMEGFSGQTSLQCSPQVLNYIQKPSRFLSLTQKDSSRNNPTSKGESPSQTITRLGRRLFEE